MAEVQNNHAEVSDERLAYLAKWSIYYDLPGGVIVPRDSEPTQEEIISILRELQERRSEPTSEVQVTKEGMAAIDRLDSALCNFLNNVGDEYDPRVWLPSLKRNLAELSAAYNDCHRAGVMDIQRAALSQSQPAPQPDVKAEPVSLAMLDDLDTEHARLESVVTSAELAKRTGKPLDAPLERGGFPPELREQPDAKASGVEGRFGRFGHHPDPAIDFEIEVQSLEARLFDAKGGISKPGTEPETVEAVLTDIERAMTFRVGGDPSAVAAKQVLRDLERNAKASTPPTEAGVEEPERLSPDAHCNWGGDIGHERTLRMKPDPDGEYVRLSDHNTIVERLKRQNSALEQNCRDFNEAGLSLAEQRDRALRDETFWQNFTDTLQQDCDKFLARAKQAETALTTERKRGARLREAFQHADDSDWEHLFTMLHDTERGRFWKSVMSEARAALRELKGGE